MIAIVAKNPIGQMNPKEPKVTLSASVEPVYRERFEVIAKQKRWTLSQTVQYFIEEFLDDWETELGIDTLPSPPTTDKKSKKRP